jgi:hypothetical protein
MAVYHYFVYLFNNKRILTDIISITFTKNLWNFLISAVPNY